MSDESTRTVQAVFSTREAADRAVEHLVQVQGIERSDIFIDALGNDNTVGILPSGADNPQAGARAPSPGPALKTKVRVSADVRRDEVEKARNALRDADGEDLATR